MNITLKNKEYISNKEYTSINSLCVYSLFRLLMCLTHLRSTYLARLAVQGIINQYTCLHCYGNTAV